VQHFELLSNRFLADSAHKKQAVSTTTATTTTATTITTTTTTTAAIIIIIIITKCYSWETALLVPYFITKKSLQHYVSRNMVCFRYILVNRLYKGDK
jgi:hypothetical protein